LGVEATFLESQAQADYENNITEFAEQGYDMIITVGFLLGDATYKMAAQYPDIKFAIVDFPTGGDETPNLQGILFNVHEASFPVGYVAAAMADQLDPDDPMVAYIGGMQIPPVEEFIVAYETGVKHYNQAYGKDVQFTGVYVGDFEAPDQGKTQANSLIDEGADIIMGVGGKTGNGGITAAKERGKWGVGVDVDQYYTLPNEKDILVTSTIKRLDKAVFSVIQNALEGTFGGGTNYFATLENEGVGVGPFHDFEDKVPEEIKADLEQIQYDIIRGELWTGWGEPPEGVPVAAEIDCMGGEGGTVSMIGVWSGEEEGTFKSILQPFLDECDITLEYEGTRDLAVYSTRIEGGNPPDIAGLPNPGLLAEFQDYMVPLGDIIDLSQYSPAWQSLGSVEGTVYGAFFKADTKSLVWYSPPVFEVTGYEVPATWDEMMALADQIVADGGVPWSCGIESAEATGWVSTDWIQDILLRTQGADFVEQWARHEVAWTDPAIKAAFETYYDICASDTYALGGAQGTLNTKFQDSLYPPFEDPPGAYMVRQASFAGGLIGEQFPDLVAGEDYTFFMFPEVDPSIGAPMQGGADVMALFNADNSAAVALMNYMFGAEGGKALAASGWGLSPNNQVTAADYESALQGQAATLMNEAPAFSFDADDRFPGGLNVDYWQAVVEYLGGGDLDTILERMEARATEVY
jgi:alpha-glucoside transport system substrate-binding protein